MNILVCVKQVPDTTEIKIDPVKHTLIRDGVPSIVNPFDAYALEVAARIKDKNPDTKIILLSMGPEQAKAALLECLAVGGDVAYLASGREFGGSDTLATSYILSCAIKAVEEKEGKIDLIFCGKQAIDGDTAQVGPEIATHLNIPQITYALDAELVDEKVRVKRISDLGYDMVEAALPALVTVDKTAFEPRYPSIRSKMGAKKKPITMIAPADLPIDLAQCGLKGSPTKVKKTFTPDRTKQTVKLEGEDINALTLELFKKLTDAKVL